MIPHYLTNISFKAHCQVLNASTLPRRHSSICYEKKCFFFIYHQNSLKKREREREQKTDLAVGFILFFEKDQGSLYSQGWPQTQHPPASASRYWDPGANRKYLNLHLFFPFFSIFFYFGDCILVTFLPSLFFLKYTALHGQIYSFLLRVQFGASLHEVHFRHSGSSFSHIPG